ncbi:MAG: N-6 DNA methylase [Desulfurococcaceae archaeon]
MRLSDFERKKYGAFETPVWVFEKYIYPKISSLIYDYIWVDLFCGCGNLVLPILNHIPLDKRVEFFKNQVFLFDILPEMVDQAVENAVRLGIPRSIAEENIRVKDSLREYPVEVLKRGLPVYHITNPPYMYIGYIVKNKDYRFWLDYFKGEREGLQDLYQLALFNDVKHGVSRMIYIIPTNFLYGSSVSNEIRRIVLEHYNIREAIIFEKQIFDYTGQHVGIFFFERKPYPIHSPQTFKVLKINKLEVEKTITVAPVNNYRAGIDFYEFTKTFKSIKPVKTNFYLFIDEVLKNKGDLKVVCIDSNDYSSGSYSRRVFYVNNKLYEKIKNNDLFIKTLDGVRESEKAGLYSIRRVFNADCIIVSKKPYRTHPIQVFTTPSLSKEDREMLMKYFNLVLNYFRELTDSEFMTTYKYSDASFTRKYLGLTQVKALIETFPILEISTDEKEKFKQLIESQDAEGVISFLKDLRKYGDLRRWF